MTANDKILVAIGVQLLLTEWNDVLVELWLTLLA